ncbi:MAG: protocatechuate 3,4-dioxygenase subunit beta [Candidatus Promineifilaceae bacterium]|nr:protocatechuate 3,4-dioxygenase subunit beta [Candidatus Promineifilaceae bacterium]
MTELVRFNSIDWDSQPPYLYPPYASTVARSPSRPLVPMEQSLSELTGPVYGFDDLHPLDNDLTKNSAKDGEAIGERIIVTGRLLDDWGKPIPNALIEVWQANAAGRYMHKVDQHDAPLDRNFHGAGRVLTNKNGEYKFTSIRPGPYPWRNHHNAWRPSHIHFSVIGVNFMQRMVTQMYFPGDPLLPLDPIYNGITDEDARKRLISTFDHDTVSVPEWAIGYRFDIVVCGPRQTPFE